jgi:hypothetical protein
MIMHTKIYVRDLESKYWHLVEIMRVRRHEMYTIETICGMFITGDYDLYILKPEIVCSTCCESMERREKNDEERN